MEDFSKILQEALGGEATGRVVITAKSKEELMSKLLDHLTEEVSAEEADKAEEERLTDMAMNMTPERAAKLATSALLGAGREFTDGHEKCSQFKMEAAAMWLATSEHLLRLRQNQEALEEKLKAEEVIRMYSDGLTSPEPVANLGLASTRELLVELETRFAVPTPNTSARGDVALMLQQLDGDTLDYRTVPGSGNGE